MFKDENLQFIIYVLAIGILMILTFCIMQVFILGKDVPFLDEFGFGSPSKTPYVYDNPPTKITKDDKDYQARIQTNLGNFTIELFEENAPNTVNNFVFLASEGYYDKVKIHRVLKDLLFQTGDRNTLTDNTATYGMGDPGYKFNDEINWPSLNLDAGQVAALSAAGYTSSSGIISKQLERYSIAMANSGPDSNGSQFFIVTASNTDPQLKNLNGKHTVFGKVVSGFDTLDDINNAPVDITNKNTPVPYKDIIIDRIDIIEINK